MIQALYAAASGMMAVEDQQSVLANNIVNASTPGFKRQNAVTEGFYSLLLEKMHNPAFLDAQNRPGGGLRLQRTYTDFADGMLATTGDPLNIALVGPGFIRVETPQGERFTRDGRFTLNGQSQLTTIEGHPVLSPNRLPITVPEGRLEFDSDGNVLVNGQVAARLDLVEFDNAGALMREGNSLYNAPPAALDTARRAEATRVVSGALELSNVQIPTEMAQMMVGLRAYGAYQRVINSTDETMGRLIEQVAMPV